MPVSRASTGQECGERRHINGIRPETVIGGWHKAAPWLPSAKEQAQAARAAGGQGQRKAASGAISVGMDSANNAVIPGATFKTVCEGNHHCPTTALWIRG